MDPLHQGHKPILRPVRSLEWNA